MLSSFPYIHPFLLHPTRPMIALLFFSLFLPSCLESNPQPSPLSDTKENAADTSWQDVMEPGDMVDFTDTSTLDSQKDAAVPGSCDGQDCSGHGTCLLFDDQPTCLCDPGWENDGAFACVPLPPGQWCDLEGWCFEHPRVPPYTLSNIHTPSRGQIRVACELGFVLNGDGFGGTIEQTGGPRAPTDMVGFGEDFLMVVGEEGRFAYLDGGSWVTGQVPDVESLSTVGGTAPDDLWAAEGFWEGSLQGYDVVWHAMLYRWNGSDWTSHPSPHNGYRVISIRSGIDKSTWMAGHFQAQFGDTQPPSLQAALFRLDGTQWTSVDGSAQQDTELLTMAAWSAAEVYLMVQSAPSSFSEQPGPARLQRWNGTTLDELGEFAGFYPTAMFCPESGSVWMVSVEGDVVHWTPEKTTRFDLPWAESAWLTAVSGTADDDIWVSGQGGVLAHWDGLHWTSLQAQLVVSDFAAVTGTSPTDIWAVGGMQSSWLPSASHALHWDGSLFSDTLVGIPPLFTAAHARTPDDVWAVGTVYTTSQASIAHWNGQAWDHTTLDSTGILNGVWAADEQTVWAVGSAEVGPEGLDKAAILKAEAGVWEEVEIMQKTLLYGIRGFAQDDIWAWGSSKLKAAAFHWTGDDWQEFSLCDSGLLLDIQGQASNDLWALVYWCTPENQCGGRLFRWNGSTWTQFWESLDGPVKALAVQDNQSVWVLGEDSGYYWNGSAWSAFVPLWPSLADAAVFDNQLWAVGALAIVRKLLP